MPVDAKSIKAVVDGAAETIDAYIEDVDAALGNSAVGMAEPSDDVLLAFFAKQNALYPPAWYTLPDGREVFTSPWILAQGVTENGDDWTRRYNRITAKYGVR